MANVFHVLSAFKWWIHYDAVIRFLMFKEISELDVVSLCRQNIGERVVPLDGEKLNAWALFLEGVQDIALAARRLKNFVTALHVGKLQHPFDDRTRRRKEAGKFLTDEFAFGNLNRVIAAGFPSVTEIF